MARGVMQRERGKRPHFAVNPAEIVSASFLSPFSKDSLLPNGTLRSEQIPCEWKGFQFRIDHCPRQKRDDSEKTDYAVGRELQKNAVSSWNVIGSHFENAVSARGGCIGFDKGVDFFWISHIM